MTTRHRWTVRALGLLSMICCGTGRAQDSPPSSNMGQPSPAAIVSWLRDAYSARPPVAMDIEVNTLLQVQGSDEPIANRAVIQYRQDHDRIDLDVQRFRTINGVERQGYASRSFWNGTQQFHRQQDRGPQASPALDASISDSSNWVTRLRTARETGLFIDGLFPGDGKHFSAFLEGAKDIRAEQVSPAPGGRTLVLLEADTPGGQYRVWLDPQQNNQVVKAIVTRDERHLIDGEPLSSGGRAIAKLQWEAFDIRYETVQGIPVAVEGKLLGTTTLKGGGTDQTETHVKRANIQWNPDFAALGAFQIDLPEGTTITHDEFPGVIYAWQGGRIAPKVDNAVVQALDSAALGLRSKGTSAAATFSPGTSVRMAGPAADSAGPMAAARGAPSQWGYLAALIAAVLVVVPLAIWMMIASGGVKR